MRLLLLLPLLGCFGLQEVPPTQPRPLFDGRTFQGWEGDTIKTWRIANGTLTGGSLTETVPHNEFLCTRESFGDFRLTLEFKLVGTGFVNAGVQFRSRRSTNPSYEMIGYQADLGPGYWGCLYDESRRNRVLARPDSAAVHAALKPADWNRYRIECRGRRIRIWLNDQPTVDYTEPDATLPQSGVIGLQIHGGGKALVAYRAVMLEAF